MPQEMPGRRPTAMLLLTIGHLLVGTLLVGNGLCCGSWQLILGDQFFIGGAPPPRQREQADRFIAYRAERLPWYPSVRAGSVIGSLLFGSVWLICGIGYWRVSRWARSLSLIGAVLAVAVGGGLLFYQILVIDPAVREFFRADVIQLGRGAAIEATLQAEGWAALVSSGILACYGAVVFVGLRISAVRLVDELRAAASSVLSGAAPVDGSAAEPGVALDRADIPVFRDITFHATGPASERSRSAAK